MKRGMVLFGVLLIVLLFGIVSGADIKDDEERENFLWAVMKKSFQWLFSNEVLSMGYGECVEDSDCGEPVREVISQYCSNNQIWEDVKILYCEVGECFENTYPEFVEEAGDCYICDDSSDEPKFIFNDGAPCKNDIGREGICVSGECEINDCDVLIENFDYKKCPRYSSNPEKEKYTCCADDETCCGAGSEFPICCSSEEECVPKPFLGGLKKLKNLKEKVDAGEMSRLKFFAEVTRSMFNPLKNSYICGLKENSCEEKGMKTCPGGYASSCCSKEGTDSECLTFKPIILEIYKDVLNFIKSSKEFENYIDISIGICGNKICPEGEEICDDAEGSKIEMGGVVCYNPDEEECITGNIYGSPMGGLTSFYPPFVQPLSCGEGFTECSAIIPLSGQIHRICCRDGVETCVKDPLWYLRCLNLVEKTGNPSLTKTTSIYMIRGEEEFSLDGGAFVIEPHVEFEKEVTVTINDEIKSGEDVFKYDEHDAVLENCDVSQIDSVSVKVGSEGGKISLDDKIVLDIPTGALSEEVEFTVSSYELSNCYEVGKKLDIKKISVPTELISDLEAPDTEENYRVIIYLAVGLGILIFIILLVLITRYNRKK